MEEAGIGFREAVSDSRFEVTKQLLANTNMSVAQISAILGYSNPGVLTRSFTRWAGISPREWRSS